MEKQEKLPKERKERKGKKTDTIIGKDESRSKRRKIKGKMKEKGKAK